MAFAITFRPDDKAKSLPLLEEPFQPSKRFYLRRTGIKSRRFECTVKRGRRKMPVFAYHNDRF